MSAASYPEIDLHNISKEKLTPKILSFTMQTPEQTDEQKLKQARSILLLNLSMMLFCLTAFLKALDSHVLWKIICSATGLAIFMALCTALFLRLRKLNKELKGSQP
jgi:hypothetical protein